MGCLSAQGLDVVGDFLLKFEFEVEHGIEFG